MPSFCVAAWNVANLFEPGAVVRGPATQQELDQKIAHLAGILSQIHNNNSPHLLGLTEVGTERIFDELADALNGNYLSIWIEPATAVQTGLGLLARDDVFGDLREIEVERPTIMSRPRILLAEAELHGVAEPIVIGLNHWKSRMVQGGNDPTADRNESARWLADRLSVRDRNTCVLLFGDFNAEPFESPFNEAGLRGVRFFSTALWGGATPAYLYNTAWRMVPEPDLWEDLEAANGQVTRPRTSHDTSPPVLFDHLLVSKRGLKNGPITLREASVRYHVVDGVTSLRSGSGNLVPRRWEFVSNQSFSGASDHYPLIAEFEIN